MHVHRPSCSGVRDDEPPAPVRVRLHSFQRPPQSVTLSDLSIIIHPIALASIWSPDRKRETVANEYCTFPFRAWMLQIVTGENKSRRRPMIYHSCPSLPKALEWVRAERGLQPYRAKDKVRCKSSSVPNVVDHDVPPTVNHRAWLHINIASHPNEHKERQRST